MTAAGEHPFEGPFVVDRERHRIGRAVVPPRDVSRAWTAAGLAQLQRERAVAAAREAEFILRFAELCPLDDDPPPDHPGARRRGWSPHEERPGVSEFFLDELAMTLNVGRGTAAFRARRAFCWRDKLPATFAALKRGEIDERRAQELFLVLEHVSADLARRIDAALIGQAVDHSVAKLGRRARELLVELDGAAAEDRRRQVRDDADVFCQDRGDGITTIGADLPSDQAAEAYELINHLALLAKQDGDERPIYRIRTEIYSTLLRYPGLLTGVAAHLTITATLEGLEGRTATPGQVNGHTITPAQLTELLSRIGALGLRTPQGGSCTLGLLDGDGRLLATTTPDDLQRRVARGDGLDPPPATDAYEPTDAQRAFVTTRDRTCRFPNCGQRTGWADHDHVIPHADGGRTTCTNLCCLCRSHHRLKTFAPGWSFQMLPDGTLEVTTPSGITRITRPPGLRPPPPGLDPPVESAAREVDPPPF